MNRFSVRTILLTALALIVGIAVWIYRPGFSGSEPAGKNAAKKTNAKTAGKSPLAADGFLTAKEIDALLRKGKTGQAEYEAYRAYARYPHESRPLTPEMTDLINPWKVRATPLPINTNPDLQNENSVQKLIEKMREQGKSDAQIEEFFKKETKDRPTFLFDGNRHTLTYGDELVVTLEVTSPAGDILPVTIREASIVGDRQMGGKRLGSADFNDQGNAPDAAAGDNINTFSWRIPGKDKKYWGNLQLRAVVSVPGIKDDVILWYDFYGSPDAPAEFLDDFSEKLVDGSLVIDVTLDVKKECRYSIGANLYTERDDQPTHWVSQQKILKPGTHKISLLFFGKRFHEGGFEGKFVMKDLRGSCENMPFPPSWLEDPSKNDAILNTPPLDEPLLLYIPYSAATYTTASYSLNDFSDAEWTSEEKNRQLEMLKQK